MRPISPARDKFAPVALSMLAVFVGALFFGTQLATAQEPNDDFAATWTVPGSAREIADSLEGGINRPDTLLGLFETEDFDTDPTMTDDDSSFLGDGFASALYRVPVPDTGSINWIVSGTGDETFFGEHSESGDFDVFLQVFDADDTSIDFLQATNVTLDAGFVIPFTIPVESAWVGGTFDIFLDNSIVPGGPDPRDFFRFTELTPGTPFVADVSALTLDSVLGWFDGQTGELLYSDDDSGVGFTSRLTGIVPTSGELVLAVTGFDDQTFSESHTQTGDYELSVQVIDADFNDDGLIDTADVDALVAEISLGPSDDALYFDINGDRTIDAFDLAEWLDVALPGPDAFLMGDANLDGVVDGLDFGSWNANKNIAVPRWSAGDFTADGLVDAADFEIWNDNRFRAAAATALPSVPEPSSWGLTWLAALVWGVRTRSGRDAG